MADSLGVLYLIPCPVAEGAAAQTLPAAIPEAVNGLRHFFVENARSARRFIRSICPQYDLDAATWSILEKHAAPDLALLIQWLKAGLDVGLISEAGCPAVADPGAEVVAAAHATNARVIPLTGPSSVLLTIMASGLNGQRFAFEGYLPIKEPERSKRLRALEERSRAEGQTQLFIETPYRNNALLQDVLKNCSPGTRLCIAVDITGAAEWIRTKTVADWTNENITLPKEPAVFALLAV